MDQEIAQKLAEQDKKLDLIYASIEKMRKYFLWTMLITIATIVMPIIALITVIPWFLSVMTKAYSF
jgi:hypothetical protein